MSASLLLRPVGTSTKRRINNFGIELECLDRGDDDSDSYCCYDCNGPRDEWSGGGSGNVATYVAAFVEHGLIDAVDNDQHPYHCSCGRCCYTREFPHFTAQEDCTVGVEFVSRILHSDTDDGIVDAACKAHDAAMRATGWRPDGYGSYGNHIHISRRGTDNGHAAFRGGTLNQMQALVTATFAAGRWDRVAHGGCGTLRTYNGSQPGKRPTSTVAELDVYTSWLSQRSATMEFRIWNTPSDAERIKAHVGLSLALWRWAATQVISNRDEIARLNFGEFFERLEHNLDDFREVLVDAAPEPFRHQAALALEGLTIEPNTNVRPY